MWRTIPGLRSPPPSGFASNSDSDTDDPTLIFAAGAATTIAVCSTKYSSVMRPQKTGGGTSATRCDFLPPGATQHRDAMPPPTCPRRSYNCDAHVHANATPARNGGRRAGAMEGATATVVRLEAQFFAEKMDRCWGWDGWRDTGVLSRAFHRRFRPSTLHPASGANVAWVPQLANFLGFSPLPCEPCTALPFRIYLGIKPSEPHTSRIRELTFCALITVQRDTWVGVGARGQSPLTTLSLTPFCATEGILSLTPFCATEDIRL
ncbi:hypothetical protein DFH09DRAFT_1085547 [Mycena vulgaris]|nr:hypothetical protein DFH09DRAFT_1085547 [Mycena vulgaris]